MTIKQKRVLGSHLQKIAQEYNNAPMRNLEEALLEVFEENESMATQELGELLAQSVLDSHVVGLAEHQIPGFQALWVTAVTDMRS